MKRISSSMNHLDDLRDLSSQQAKDCLNGLRRRVADLQRSLDNPDQGVDRVYLQQCRNFKSKARDHLTIYETKVLAATRTGPLGARQEKSNTTGAKSQDGTTYTTSTEVIDLTGGTSEEDTAKADPKAERSAFDPSLASLFDSSSGPVIVRPQDSTRGILAVAAANIQKRGKHDAEVHHKLNRSAITQKAQKTLAGMVSTTSRLASDRSDARPAEMYLYNTHKSAKNETSVQQYFQALAAEQEDFSFFEEKSVSLRGGMLEAAMDRRDHELWYDPSVDFEEDLLP